jgi:hypothetical protein
MCVGIRPEEKKCVGEASYLAPLYRSRSGFSSKDVKNCVFFSPTPFFLRPFRFPFREMELV